MKDSGFLLEINFTSNWLYFLLGVLHILRINLSSTTARFKSAFRVLLTSHSMMTPPTFDPIIAASATTNVGGLSNYRLSILDSKSLMIECMIAEPSGSAGLEGIHRWPILRGFQ